jgi:hypothetical protein
VCRKLNSGEDCGEEEEDLLDLFEGLGLILREVSGLLGDFDNSGSRSPPFMSCLRSAARTSDDSWTPASTAFGKRGDTHCHRSTSTDAISVRTLAPTPA